MRREGTLEEISDGRLYQRTDMVRANCMDCQNCSDCCKGMGNTIQLDPLDVSRLCKDTENTMQGLLQTGAIQLTVVDGLILPSMGMQGEKSACYFLNEKGRCSIHKSRPGICRLFPLGRYYENGVFSYFLQANECSMKNRSKIKVEKWLDTPNIVKYETFVTNWHYLLKDIEQWLQENGMENQKQMATTVLQFFYENPYQGSDFYMEFEERRKKFRHAFSMEK
ncbi:MAG: YkgJ family cysteine cluster protein [Lachnospiraceae bacterium]|nr:YkgJ family cysteine cluster protein [Lachnospiraceae bacterium]